MDVFTAFLKLPCYSPSSPARTEYPKELTPKVLDKQPGQNRKTKKANLSL